MSYVNLNGRFLKEDEALIPVSYWGLRFGYAIFETMLVLNGRIMLAAYHWERLANGMKILGWTMPHHTSFATIEEEVLLTVKKNSLGHRCRVRVQVFTKCTSVFDDADTNIEYLIECTPVEPAAIAWNDHGLIVGIASGIEKATGSLAALKSCDAIAYKIAAHQSRQNKWNDALICNPSGRIAESTIANIFIVAGDDIITPPLSEGCVAGVMRRYLIETLPGVIQKPITIDDLRNADEVFLTNAVRGIKWVGTFEHKHYACTKSRQISESLHSKMI